MMLYGKSSQDGVPTPENPVEIKSVVNPTMKVCGKNLLNATLQTTTVKGVTCTANGDGTYTLNGTATTITTFDIAQDVSCSSFRLVGCPVGGAHDASYELQARTNNLIYGYDTGDGKNIKADKNFFIRIRINTGINCNNLLFKPMIVDASLYPDATYDDFEPYHKQTVTLPYSLNAIPVNSGGNVTINGQQYVADYVDVERGKLVKMVDSSKLDNTQSIMGKTEWLLVEPQEIDLTQEEMQTLKTLATYYPTTNIFINSEQLDGYTVFNYPISMENDWNHVKQQIGDMREDFVNLKEYVKGANLPETWEQVVLAIKSKLYKEMYAVGDKFSNIWKDTNNSNKEYDNPLRINHFEDGLELEDGTTVNGMWLQTVYAHLKGVQFSHQQAFYVSGDGMVAGTYCVGFDYTWGDKGYVTKGDYWNFTLTKDVPAGGRLAGFYGAPDQPQTNWRVYVYSADGKTVLETVSAINKGQEGTLLGVMTAYGDENLNGIQQMAYGDNRYATSAIRQYLNSDKPKGEWWTAQTKWDIAPDQLSQIDGYLCGMDPELLAVLKPVKVVTYCNTVTATGQKQVKDITYDKVTLISLEQMYIEPQAAGEGEAHEYYKELNGTAKKFQWWQTYEILKTFAVENPTSPQSVRLRSANRSYACNTWYVYSSGGVFNGYASYAIRPAPLMFIGAAPSDTISAPTDAESTQEDKSQEAVA